jgi:two-component system, LytTR family, response regulator LytT
LKRVLIVDDEIETAEIIKEFIEFEKLADVSIIDQGVEAIEFIKTNKPDIVFLDIQLRGDVDGMEVLESSKTFSIRTKFYIVSAYRDEYEQETIKQGAIFLGKPVSLDTVGKIITTDGEMRR